MNMLTDKPVVEVDRYPAWMFWTVDQCSSLVAIQTDLDNSVVEEVWYVQRAFFWINLKIAYPSTLAKPQQRESLIITTKSCPDIDI